MSAAVTSGASTASVHGVSVVPMSHRSPHGMMKRTEVSVRVMMPSPGGASIRSLGTVTWMPFEASTSRPPCAPAATCCCPVHTPVARIVDCAWMVNSSPVSSSRTRTPVTGRGSSGVDEAGVAAAGLGASAETELASPAGGEPASAGDAESLPRRYSSTRTRFAAEAPKPAADRTRVSTSRASSTCASKYSMPPWGATRPGKRSFTAPGPRWRWTGTARRWPTRADMTS